MSNEIKEYLGIAAEDKVKNSRNLKVYVDKLLPFLEGNLTAIDSPVQTSLTDKHAGNLKTSVTETNYILATFRDDESNSQDPPDVVRGEQVKVFHYKDSSIFYWRSTGRNDVLRKTEHKRFQISNSQTIPDSQDDDNTFFIDLDSRELKHIVIGTSKACGEKFSYRIKLDALSSQVHICDDDNNEIFMDSVEKIIRMRNNVGTYIEIEKEDMTIVAVRDIIMKAGRQIILDTPIFTAENTNGDGVMVWNSNGLAMNVGDTFTVTSQCIGLNGAVVMPNTVVTGPLQAESYSTGKVKK